MTPEQRQALLIAKANETAAQAATAGTAEVLERAWAAHRANQQELARRTSDLLDIADRIGPEAVEVLRELGT